MWVVASQPQLLVELPTNRGLAGAQSPSGSPGFSGGLQMHGLGADFVLELSKV